MLNKYTCPFVPKQHQNTPAALRHCWRRKQQQHTEEVCAADKADYAYWCDLL